MHAPAFSDWLRRTRERNVVRFHDPVPWFVTLSSWWLRATSWFLGLLFHRSPCEKLHWRWEQACFCRRGVPGPNWAGGVFLFADRGEYITVEETPMKTRLDPNLSAHCIVCRDVTPATIERGRENPRFSCGACGTSYARATQNVLVKMLPGGAIRTVG